MIENIIFISKQSQIPLNTTYIPSTNIQQVYDYVESVDEICVDTENSGLDPHTGYEYCFQIGDDKVQYIIDCLTFTYEEIKPLLIHKDKLYILQNAKYDLQWFYKHDIIIEGKIWDTYLAELRLVNGIIGVKKNLQALEEKYLQTNYVDKSKRKDIHTIPKIGYTERVLKYSAGDVLVLPGIKKTQLEIAIKEKQVKIIHLECEFVKVLAYSEYCGIYVDKDKWLKIAITNEVKLNKLTIQLNNWILDNRVNLPFLEKYIDTQLSLFSNDGPSILLNWNSSKQLIGLFETLGINCTVIEKGKTKKSVEAKLLKTQKNKSKLIPIYLKYSSVYKEVSTYGRDFLKFVNTKTNRIHPSYFQVLASGRLASGGDEQSKDSRTANIMVIPREGGYRSCFTAQDPINNILINYDYSAMENIVFANKCKDSIHMEQILKGIDQHSYVAKLAFKEELKDISQEEVKYKAKNFRQDAKAVGFAILFGGSDYTISKNLGVTQAKAKEIYDAYFNGYPRFAEYFEECEINAIKKGHILIDDLSGAKYYIDGYDRFKELHEKLSFDNKKYWRIYKEEKKKQSNEFIPLKEEVSYYFRWKGAIKRHALNLPVQGTSSNIIKIAAIYLFREIIKRGWFNTAKVVLFLHDEYMSEAPNDIADELAELMYESMIKAANVYCKDVPLDAAGGKTEVWDH